MTSHVRFPAVPQGRASDQALANQLYLGGADLGLADIPAGTALFRPFGLEVERPSVPNVEAWCTRLQERPAYREHAKVPSGDLKGKPDGAMTDLRICFVGDSFVNGTGDDARVAAVSAALGRLCAELDVPFLNLHGPLSGDATWRAEALAGDGVHPNAGGYARAAPLVEAWAPWRAWTSWQSHGGARWGTTVAS